MKRLALVLWLIMLSAFLFVGSASAVISFDTTVTDIQQTLNNPCVIGDQSCKQPTNFGYNGNSGTPGGQNGSTYDLFSTTYLAGGSIAGNGVPTLDQIVSSFTIGVDENIAAGASGGEFLVFFKTYVCNPTATTGTGCNNTTNQPQTTTDKSDGGGGGISPATLPTGLTLDAGNSYQGPPVAIPNLNNGNGYSDFGLTGFNLISGSLYVFEVRVSNDTDGMEEFFIITTPTKKVPEPGVLFFMGVALVAVGIWGRKHLLNNK